MKLSVHKLRTFRRCPKLYWYTQVAKIEPIKKSDALNFGSLFHAGLNAWWLPKHASPEARIGAALAALNEHWQNNFRVLDAYAGVTATEMMRAYHERWKDEVGIRSVGVEVEFETTTCGPHSRGGRMDLVVEVDVDGEWRLAIGEHKTTTEDISPGSPYWTRLRVDTQVSEYMLAGANYFDQHVDFVVYDVSLKPDITPHRATPVESRKFTKGKPCKKHLAPEQIDGLPCINCDGSGWLEAPKLYANQRDRDEHPEEWRERLKEWMAKQPHLFARQVVPRLEHELVEADREAVQTGDMIQSCTVANVWPKNDQACSMFGRPCDFRDVCNGVARLDDPTRFRERTFDNAPMKEQQNGNDLSTVSDPDADEFTPVADAEEA